MVADALAERLAREPDGFLVGHGRSFDTRLIHGMRAHGPDVVLIDARTVPTHWTHLLDPLVAGMPEARIAVLADTTEVDDAVLAAHRGVAAWLRSDATADHVIGALRVIADGGTVFSPSVLGAVLRRLVEEVRDAGAPAGPLRALTERERDVLACLLGGRQSSEIADELKMAVNTVRAHTARILRKLGVHSRLEAVRVARQYGFDPGGRPVEADRTYVVRMNLVSTDVDCTAVEGPG